MSFINEEESFIVPPYINLLFNNNQLELLKTLCLLYALFRKSKRKFNKITDISFYFSLVNFDMLKILQVGEDKENVTRNQYFRYRQNINYIILELSNLGFIEVKGTIEYKTVDLGVRLTKSGNEFVEGLEIEYFLELINNYSNVITEIDHNTENKNMIKGG